MNSYVILNCIKHIADFDIFLPNWIDIDDLSMLQHRSEPIVGLRFVLRTVCNNNDNGISFSREHVVRLLSKQPGFVKEFFQDEQKHSNSIVSYFYSLK